MIEIVIPKTEAFDEATNRFIRVPETKLRLEHSLVSVHRWESKYCKPFLERNKVDPSKMTTEELREYDEELIEYIRCMTMDKQVDPNIYYAIPKSELIRINEYIQSPMTAHTVVRKKPNGGRKKEPITSELIYYWMIQFGIPFECERWHLNQLLALIDTCGEEIDKQNAKNGTGKKMTQKEIYAQNDYLNNLRRAKYNTKG